jgi:omega-6 fatty acid desaturase (delta-12 desaturase)
MTDRSQGTEPGPLETPARDWVRILAQYREPVAWRSVFELAVTFVPFAVLWAAAVWALPVSPWLTLAFSILSAAFLVRLFLIQHDCGHGALFRKKAVNDWVGRVLGVFTLTPYDVWRRGHAIHHASSGNLDKRGVGDIHTKTVREYQALSLRDRFIYRLYRHPLTLFVVFPTYVFLFQNRLPVGFMGDGWKYWASAMATNAATAVLAGVLIHFIGLAPFLLIYLPVSLMAAATGIWLFYVQHQFEETYWNRDKDWKLHDAALYGSSHYCLPGVLPWMTANIGVHHVHHLYCRIPFYRLQQVLRDHPALAEVRHLGLLESFACVGLQLWDENRRKLVSYAEVRGY